MRKKKLFILLIASLFLMSSLTTHAFAADTANWSNYSYDELVALRDNLDSYIKELERQYAIENGNRIITLNDNTPTVFKGKTFTLIPEVTRVIEDAPESTSFVWTSSDENIAKVSAKGVITAVNYGDAIITCSAADDEFIFSEATVHVALPVEKLTIGEPKVTLLISDQDPSAANATLVCTVFPENAHIQDVSWTSSNEDIATVDENGNIHAIAPGTAKITATSKEETTTPKSATCTITVLQSVTSIELNPSQTTLNVRASLNLAANVLPENAGNKKVTWESSNPDIATVSSSGRVTAVSPGTATILCTAADGSGVTSTCEVTVIQMVNTVKIDSTSTTLTVNKNDSVNLNLLITPDNATDKTVTWESSNPDAATVSDKGTVTAVNGGATTITCTTVDGSNKSAKINVYVPSISVDSLEYVVTSKDGLDIPFKYYGYEENLSISPASSTYFTAKLDQNGEKVTLKITPLKAGTGSITLSDKGDSRSKVKITVKIEHSACYDSTAYPVGNYTNIMRAPSSYKGEPMSAYGRVLQVSQGWFNTVLRVATQGRWDNVFYISCDNDIAKGIIEDDYITIYGECTGAETYTTVLGGSITIPAIEAEKIYLGRH